MDTLCKLPLVLGARAFAFEAHTGQVRNNKARQPYVYHLEEVARLVELSGGTEIEIAGGWLHDAVEDTPATLEEIVRRFGEDVGQIVHGLTDHAEWLSLPLLERKSLQAARVKEESVLVRRVKLSDQISNVRCVAIDWPTAWDKAKCLDYAEGARRIAESCQGISSYLDIQFNEAFAEALRVHG